MFRGEFEIKSKKTARTLAYTKTLLNAITTAKRFEMDTYIMRQSHVEAMVVKSKVYMRKKFDNIK